MEKIEKEIDGKKQTLYRGDSGKLWHISSFPKEFLFPPSDDNEDDQQKEKQDSS